MTSFDSNYLCKGPVPNTVAFEARASTLESGGGAIIIQPITMSFPALQSKPHATSCMFVSPQNSYVELLAPKGDGISR